MFKINENVVKNNSVKKTAKFIGISALAFLTTAAPLASTALNAATAATPTVATLSNDEKLAIATQVEIEKAGDAAVKDSAAFDKYEALQTLFDSRFDADLSVKEISDAKTLLGLPDTAFVKSITGKTVVLTRALFNTAHDLQVSLNTGKGEDLSTKTMDEQTKAVEAVLPTDLTNYEEVISGVSAHKTEVSDATAAKKAADEQTKANSERGTLTSNVEAGSALAALNAAKAAVQTAKNTAQPAEKIAALQAKADLADANFQLATARANGSDASAALKLVKTAQENVVATEGKLAIALENKGRDLQAANQVKAETAAKTEAAKDLTPANLLKNLQSVTENAATTGKAAKAANAALKAAQDAKAPASEIAKLQAQADAANAAYKLADAQVKGDAFAIEAAQKAVDTANTKLLAVTQRQLAAKLVELGAKLADPKTTPAEKAVLTSEANFVQGQFNKAAAALAKPSTAVQAIAEIAKADAARPAQVKLEADNAAKAAAAKLAAEKAAAAKAYAAAHPHFKAYLNGKVVVEGDFGKSSYGLNSRVARAAHVNTGSVKVVKTRSGYSLQGLKAAKGYKITSLSFWKGRNGSFGFNVKTARIVTLSVKAHFGKHSKVVGKGEFAVGAKTRTSARGYHFHGTAQVATKRVHGRTVTYIRGLSADRHYKITKITISNYKGNKFVHVYTSHR